MKKVILKGNPYRETVKVHSGKDFFTKLQALVDEAALTELELYIPNTQKTYKAIQKVSDTMLKRMKQGKYDESRAWKGYLPSVDYAAKEYVREFGSGPVKDLFPKALRVELAKQIAEEEFQELELQL